MCLNMHVFVCEFYISIRNFLVARKFIYFMENISVIPSRSANCLSLSRSNHWRVYILLFVIVHAFYRIFFNKICILHVINIFCYYYHCYCTLLRMPCRISILEAWITWNSYNRRNLGWLSIDGKEWGWDGVKDRGWTIDW